LEFNCWLSLEIIKCTLGKSDLLVVGQHDNPERNTLISTAELGDVSLLFWPVGALGVADNLAFENFGEVIQVLRLGTMPLVLHILDLSAETTTRANNIWQVQTLDPEGAKDIR